METRMAKHRHRQMASVYASGGTEYLGPVLVNIGCADAFCDSCGDCLYCYGGDPCYGGGNGTGVEGGHYFTIYEDDLPEWFGPVPVAA